MTPVASRDLRNHTSEVLRQVADGTRVTITVTRRPVAELCPVREHRPRFFAKADATRDDDFDVIAAAGGPSVIRV